jgi:hypothetical protein
MSSAVQGDVWRSGHRFDFIQLAERAMMSGAVYALGRVMLGTVDVLLDLQGAPGAQRPVIAFAYQLKPKLLIPAKKWAGMNPDRIEDGPSWRMAALSALYTMLLFVLALGFLDQGNIETSAFLGSFAFGSAIGGCFLTEFEPSPQEVPNPLLRWWIGQLNGFADGAFKSIIVVPVGWVISKLSTIDGRFWSAVILALVLVTAKTGRAMLMLHSDTTDQVRKARERMLIRGSVLLTMIVGVFGLVSWLALAGPVIQSWPPFRMNDWISIGGFVLGVGFHFR